MLRCHDSLSTRGSIGTVMHIVAQLSANKLHLASAHIAVFNKQEPMAPACV